MKAIALGFFVFLFSCARMTSAGKAQKLTPDFALQALTNGQLTVLKSCASASEDCAARIKKITCWSAQTDLGFDQNCASTNRFFAI